MMLGERVRVRDLNADVNLTALLLPALFH